MAEVTLLLAFAAGLISFLSPCVLPLIPAFLTYLAGSSSNELQKNPSQAKKKIFFSSVFFVLGFSVVFSLLGVLLQSVLSGVAFDLRTYLGYLGGAFIIFFGLTLTGLIQIDFLQKDHKFDVQKTRHSYPTSFLFGAAFAVGWTPCVGAVLGSVLTLAATQPQTALPLMLAYSLGLGIPFLAAGLFLSRLTGFIQKISPHLKTLNIVFGMLLIVLGILVFTNTLNVVANWFPALGLAESLMGN
ncbi:sulfite exporter TauE/SafE family protein [Candidatus Micrarchaeota archaeon]|nr:sulfite exporter TauE/SafE family protein [Candidatus Micrarchaeota archaeon]